MHDLFDASPRAFGPENPCEVTHVSLGSRFGLRNRQKSSRWKVESASQTIGLEHYVHDEGSIPSDADLFAAAERKVQEDEELLRALRAKQCELEALLRDAGAAINAMRSTGSWPCSLLLAGAAEARGLKLNDMTYGTTIASCELQGEWEVALSLLAHLRTITASPSALTLSACVAVCGRGGQWERALDMLPEEPGDANARESIIYNSAITACERCGQWDMAFRVFESMSDRKVSRDLLTYNAALSACQARDGWIKAFRFLDELRADGLAPDVVSFGSVVTSLERGYQWERALSILAIMADEQVEKDLSLCNAVLSAVEKGKQWERAFLIFEQLKTSNLRADIISYNTLLGAVEHAAQWPLVLDIMQQMDGEALSPDVVTYSAAIGVLGAQEQWHRSLYLLAEMRVHAVRPNVIAYNEAITSCARVGQWAMALDLLGQISTDRLEATAVSYCAAISACQEGKAWSAALGLLAHMSEARLSPNVLVFNAATLACIEAGWWQDAFAILRDMQQGKVQPDKVSFTMLMMEAEQRGRISSEELALLKLLGGMQVYSEDLQRSLAAACGNAAALRLAAASRVSEAVHVLQDCADVGAANVASAEIAERLLSDKAAASVRGRSKTQRRSTKDLISALRGTPRLATSSLLQSGASDMVRAPYSKELHLLEFVLDSARAGDLDSACGAVEQFGSHVLGSTAMWLKVAAGSKTHVRGSALSGAPAGGGTVLEIGCYVGYSAMRMAQAVPDVRITSLEVDPVHCVIARNILAYAGLDGVVDVWTGHSKDLVCRLTGPEHGDGKPLFSFVFMDHRGSIFHIDLKVLMEEGLLAPGATIVADNVLKPGAPLFLWEVTRSPRCKSQLARVWEFAMPAEDWMSVTVCNEAPEKGRGKSRAAGRKSKRLASQTPSCPSELLHLDKHCDRMREKAMGPGRGVTYRDWAAFASDVSDQLANICDMEATCEP
eukprot:TRINITY_DN38231_c0_g3_i1.p1 TRINITY_DN38231_c0_g3~~TRINITY_DN38231_c0_g3_i1.p1  ORF type:complete len:953 (+),score=174.36 TRINITY_DN38231_c0_g3_i1:125-2983(+)